MSPTAAPTRTLISKPGRTPVSVNGTVIGGQDILREARNHQDQQPADAWKSAATALVVKELLIQEARRLAITGMPMNDGEGRTETSEEAAIRSLVEREAAAPSPTDEECRRYYGANRPRFRSATLTEASHILFAAAPEDTESYRAAEAEAEAVIATLLADPSGFAELARRHSKCPSAGQGGSLGQLLPGSTVPEFEMALAAMCPGEISTRPVQSRFGAHVVRLERRIPGVELPFDVVRDRIAHYLRTAAEHRAHAQYVARLVSAADIRGIALAGAADHRVH